jgi:hypothetical protein
MYEGVSAPFDAGLRDKDHTRLHADCDSVRMETRITLRTASPVAFVRALQTGQQTAIDFLAEAWSCRCSDRVPGAGR